MSYYVLGIDTSNYTTSIAIVDSNKNIILDKRKLLKVANGKRGLRQSEALFQHIDNLPVLFEDIRKINLDSKIKAICCSNKPRNVDGSYMPVFKAGTSFGQVLTSTLNSSYYECSHQENHIEAALSSLDSTISEDFISIHMSGGTTELLLVKRNEKLGYNINIVGGTTDISIGQFLDRVGVKMGYQFPAGALLDKLALTSDYVISTTPKIHTKDGKISLSGPETKIMRLLDNTYDELEISILVFKYIILCLKDMITYASKKYNLNNVLLVGGVSSSDYIRNHLKNHLNNNIKLHFSDASHCTDNAVGTAMIGLKATLLKG